MALFFSDDTSGKYRANSITGAFVTTAHPYQGQILPIVDESGDWYKVEYVTKKNIGEYTSKSAWIMKRFGETKVITAGDMKYPNESESQVFRRLNGKYKGTSFVTLITNEYNDWDNYFTFCMNIPIFISQKYLLMKGVYILGYINSSGNIHKLGRTALEDVFTGDSDEYFSTNFRSLDEVDLVTFLAGLSDEDFGKLIAEAMQAQGNLYVRTENGEMLYAQMRMFLNLGIRAHPLLSHSKSPFFPRRAASTFRISPPYLARFTAEPLNMRRKSFSLICRKVSNVSDRNSEEGANSSTPVGRAKRLCGHTFWHSSHP